MPQYVTVVEGAPCPRWLTWLVAIAAFPALLVLVIGLGLGLFCHFYSAFQEDAPPPTPGSQTALATPAQGARAAHLSTVGHRRQQAALRHPGRR